VTCHIAFEALWTDAPLSDERAPLSFLSDDNTHVHGMLNIFVDGRVLPRTGFFGPDDACFNAWVRELARASDALVAADPSFHVYDEGEQGQPAFHFERSGAAVFVSVRRSAISDGPGDPTWERVRCSLDEFVAAVATFLETFRNALSEQAGPERAERWWRQLADPA